MSNTPDFQKVIEARKRSVMSRCNKLGREYRLTDDHLYCLLSETECAYTGQPMVNLGESHNCLTLERVDCDQGYVPGNVVAVTHRANVIRGNKTPDQVRKSARRYKETVKNLERSMERRKASIAAQQTHINKLKHQLRCAEGKLQKQHALLVEEGTNIVNRRGEYEYRIRLAAGLERVIQNREARKYMTFRDHVYEHIGFVKDALEGLKELVPYDTITSWLRLFKTKESN